MMPRNYGLGAKEPRQMTEKSVERYDETARNVFDSSNIDYLL